ncbi:MAG: L-aspartate oxidase [bacterium]|nr:L-aspartate oxidase [bacterium]
MKTIYFDYLVIGSGIAGLSAASKLSKKARTAILTKSSIQESSTQYAQGGIAAALHEDDTPVFHMQDTIKAGDGICNKEAVNILVKDGPDRVKELISMGANFDKIGNDFDFSYEAAHCRRRILHAADSTGKEIEKTLGNNILKNENVTFFENTSVIKLLIKNNECQGCIAIKKNKIYIFYAKSVVLATGGCAQVYSRNTNPTVSTGDGIALAYKAGCSLQDMEFIQFHPTTLYLGDKKPISLFLISETVRGEGAVLRNIPGKRFMPDYHPDAELAPRDIVARAIHNEMKKTEAQHVFLDLWGLKKDAGSRFPNIYKRCLESKIDITRDFIPVAPAAHYFMGGIKTDINGKTDIKRLYAAGEVASIGLHGANRLASNSLLDGLVFGYRAATDALKNTEVKSVLKINEIEKSIKDDYISEQTYSRIIAIKQNIREVMWSNAGIIRDGKTLNQAVSILQEMDWILNINTFKEAIFEVQNMLNVAKLITKFALERQESRGGHFRSDFPQKDDINWKYHISHSINDDAL